MSQIGILIQTLAKGGPVMIPLVGCSVVALAVVIERLGFWWRQRNERPAAAAAAMEAAAQSEMGRLRSYLPVLDTSSPSRLCSGCSAPSPG